jgi:hypothetical protein
MRASILKSHYQKQGKARCGKETDNGGIDPCEQKRVKKAVQEASNTFELVARQWHKSNKKWSKLTARGAQKS